MGAPPIYQFKCRHKDCIFRTNVKFPHHACDYAAMTGRTRTRRDKPANTAKCEFYVKRIRGYRRRGYSLTGPAWEQVALSLHHAGYDSAEIARICSAAPEAVAKLIAQRAGRSPHPKTYLGEINTARAGRFMSKACLIIRWPRNWDVPKASLSGGATLTVCQPSKPKEGGRGYDRRT